MLTMISATLLRLYGLFEREKGQALAEYGLILALIAAFCIIALGLLGVAVAGQMGIITSKLGVGGS